LIIWYLLWLFDLWVIIRIWLFDDYIDYFVKIIWCLFWLFVIIRFQLFDDYFDYLFVNYLLIILIIWFWLFDNYLHHDRIIWIIW